MRKESARVGAVPAQGYTFTRVEAQEEIARAIERLHAAGCVQIALVAIHLFYKPTRGTFSMEKRMRQGSEFLLQNIRPLVRRTDLVFLCRHVFSFVLPGANLQGAQIVEERLWEALLWRFHNMGEYEAVRPVNLAIGHSAFPEPHASLDELLRAAGEFSKRFDRREKQPLAHRVGQAQPLEQEELPKLARELGVPYLALLPNRLPQRVLHIVNARLARELRCYPLGRERNILTVAMLDPQDHQAIERLRQETGLRIFPVLTHPEALETALRQFS
jgi:hypothetical protein